jgi:hypothetical protein
MPSSATGGMKRKQMGPHVIPAGDAIPASAAGAPPTPPVRPAVKMPMPKQRLKKPAVKKVAA